MLPQLLFHPHLNFTLTCHPHPKFVTNALRRWNPSPTWINRSIFLNRLVSSLMTVQFPYFRPSGFFLFGPFAFIFHDVQFSSFGPFSFFFRTAHFCPRPSQDRPHSDHLIYKENLYPSYMTVHSLLDRPVESQWTVNFDARPFTLD